MILRMQYGHKNALCYQTHPGGDKLTQLSLQVSPVQHVYVADELESRAMDVWMSTSFGSRA